MQLISALADAGLAQAADRLLAAGGGTVLERESFAQAFDVAGRAASKSLWEVACSEPFQNAVVWQNRGFASRVRNARPGEGRGNKAASFERTITSYLQRYCTKNETIGFFGPLGFGSASSAPEGLVANPGPDLLRRRETYLEYWAVDAVALKLSEDPGVRAAVAPRRGFGVTVEGSTLWLGWSPRKRLDGLQPQWAWLLRACDGSVPAGELASRALADPSSGFSRAEEVLLALEQLAARGLIVWRVEIPPYGKPESALEKQLEAIPDPLARRRALDAFGVLRAARQRVARVASQPAQLDSELASLEQVFEQLTDQEAQRRAGVQYAGRSVVYEDCIRDVEFRLGMDVLARLARPMALMLQAQRWFTHGLASGLRRELGREYQALRPTVADPIISLELFWTRAQALSARIGGRRPAFVEQALRDLQERWSQVLGLDSGVRVIQRSAAQLEEAVRSAFPVTRPAFPFARFCSPDILIAASSAEEVSRGGGQFVIGEIHPGHNATDYWSFVDQADHAESLRQAIEAAAPHGRWIVLTPRSSTSLANIRVEPGRSEDLTLWLEGGPTPRWRAAGECFALADLGIAEFGGNLQVCTRDGSRRWDLLEVFEYLIPAINPTVTRGAHSPRVVIDDLVIARESWKFSKEEMAFARAPTPLERFVEARRWKRQHQIPRYVFVKVDGGVKPYFLDLESPPLVELVARALEKAEGASVSEMLPTPDQCWLKDAQGNSYSSELRCVFLDPEPWAPDG